MPNETETTAQLSNPDKVVATRMISESIMPNVLKSCLLRHLCGDYGVLDKHDCKANAEAIAGNGKVLSAYKVQNKSGTEVKIYCISDAGHQFIGGHTVTFLYPEEY